MKTPKKNKRKTCQNLGIRLGCAVRYFLLVDDWDGAKFKG
jgi:hypothetical protein